MAISPSPAVLQGLTQAGWRGTPSFQGQQPDGTPLLIWALRVAPPCLPALLKEAARVDPDALRGRDQNGWTVLMWACRWGHAQTYVPWLLSVGCDPRATCRVGETALMVAAETAPDLIVPLLKAGADPNAAGTEDQTTALMRAITRWNLKGQAAALYLLDGGADVNLRDIKGHTALMYACDCQGAISLLAERGAELETASIAGQQTALTLACIQGNGTGIPALLAAGANPNHVDARGMTPLMHALIHHPHLVPDLLDAGADAAAQTHDTSAMLLACTRHPHLVSLLLDAGAAPNRFPNGASSPLMEARRKADPPWDAVGALLKAGAKPALHEIPDEMSIMLWAALVWPEILTALAEAGADRTELDRAIERQPDSFTDAARAFWAELCLNRGVPDAPQVDRRMRL